MRRLKQLLLIVLSLFMIATSLLYVFQEKLIFLPTKLDKSHQYSFSVPFEEFFLEANDGAQLNALHFKKPDPEGVILYFHGNAGDLSRWGEIALFFVEQNYDVIIMDYRTYGKSTGNLTEENLFSDAELFYEYALNRYAEKEIIVYGRSLGAAIAVNVASKNEPKKLILETPFYNLLDVAKNRFSFLPVKQLLKFEFASNEYIKKVKSPIVIFHGTQDEVVPYPSGKKLFGAIPGQQKKFYTIQNGGHNDLVNFEAFRNGIDQELNQTD